MRKLFMIGLSIYCCSACHNKQAVKISEVKHVDVKQEKEEAPLPPPPPQAIMASAYMVYDDGTLSEFDVLHDKTRALWNTVIGEGDAEKPSQKVKLVFRGAYDSINVNVKNGKRLVLSKNNLSFNGMVEFIIQNTGCDEVFVNVTKDNRHLVRDTIPFHCGE